MDDEALIQHNADRIMQQLYRHLSMPKEHQIEPGDETSEIRSTVVGMLRSMWPLPVGRNIAVSFTTNKDGSLRIEIGLVQ